MTKILGLDSVKKQLKELKKKSDAAVQRGILKTANQIKVDAEAKVPVDTGELKISLGVEQQPEVTYIFASAPHAPYLEFGTGPLTQAPEGMEAYAKTFFVNGLGHTRPQPFLFPALFKNRENLNVNIEEELQKVADEFNRS